MATGGMAEIWLARVRGIEGFQKLVTVKKILPHLARDPEFLRMFIDEARIAATLQHPNVVQVYDIGESAGQYFFAMEYIHGQDLSRILRRAMKGRDRVPLEHALTIGMGMCAGLHYAHEKVGFDGHPLKLVHRDVSPQNVMVGFDGGGVKVLDFGVAKAAARSGVTRDGMLKGKTPYMSPEQCLATELDRRSDIFSMSILLWELTTTRRLFREDGEYATLKAITETDAPPPSSVFPEYPPALERIVMKGLARDPAERWQTAEELQLALEDCARKLELAPSPVALGHYLRGQFRTELDAEQAAGPPDTQVAVGVAVTRSTAPRRARWVWALLIFSILAALATAGALVISPPRRTSGDAIAAPPPAEPEAVPVPAAEPPPAAEAVVAEPAPTAEPEEKAKTRRSRPKRVTKPDDDLDAPFPR
jgi:eukaryotic-like serine/threonine-protein kinase